MRRSPPCVLLGAAALLAATIPCGRAADAETPSGRAAAAETARLSFRPYTIQSLDGSSHPAELGRLVVPELHAHPEGRSIAVTLIRLRSTAAAPGAPIVFLPGGPGYPGTLLARTPVYIQFFERLRELADVLILDQRGAGLSEPTLQCATKGSLPPDALESEVSVAAALGSMVRPCVRLVRGDGIAPEAFNTVESAEDLEDLRRALGVERIRLIGVSYGTELALELIRRHGNRVDRAVLAGTRGPDMALRLPSVSELQLRRFSALVAADSRWSADLPDFEATVRRVLQGLAKRPASLEVMDAKTKQKARVRAGPIAVQAIVASDLSDWSRAPLLPAIFASLARGDSTLFARRLEDLYNGMGGGISIMQIAVDCASGGSPERRSQVGREGKAALLGNAKNLLMNPAFCDLIGAPELGGEFREPIYSTARALFLTGTMDGITPPFQAEEVRWGFPNGIHLLVENGWHETLHLPEPQQAVLDYFAGKEVRGRRLKAPAPRFLTVAEAKAFMGSRAVR